jgi:hypothetical protein
LRKKELLRWQEPVVSCFVLERGLLDGPSTVI